MLRSKPTGGGSGESDLIFILRKKLRFWRGGERRINPFRLTLCERGTVLGGCVLAVWTAIGGGGKKKPTTRAFG